jgi:hypothetical protein
MFRSRYTSCVGTRPAAKIGKLTEWPLQRLYRGHAGQCSSPRKFIVSQKPNFFRELCCEVSGDAAREDAGRAIARSEGSSAVTCAAQ